MFDPANGLVSVSVPARAYSTRNQKGAFFADRTKDNKFYLQVMPPVKRGEKQSYRLHICAAEATEEMFTAVADRLSKLIPESQRDLR